MRRGWGFAIVAVATLFALPASGEAAPACTITGTAGADVLSGTKRADVICGRGGPDRLYGRGGADVLKGGRGNDVLAGGPGKDHLIGGAGRDSCVDKGASTHFRGCEWNAGRPHSASGVSPGCCPSYFPPADVTAPEVQIVMFTEPYVDTFSEDSTGLWVEALEGESGIGRVEAEIHGPSGPWRKLSFISGQPHGGAFTSVEVPASTPPGRYELSSLSLTDRAGNRVSFDALQLKEAGFDAVFDVYKGPDTEGPQLTEFSLTPGTLDTSAGPGSVRFSIAATDELSGVGRAVALVRLPDDGPPMCIPCSRHWMSSDLTSGTIYDGAWEQHLPLPRFAMPGIYPVTFVVLRDRAGNQTVYEPDELEALGYPIEFTQTGDGDTEPPQIVNFWMNPGTLQTSGGNQTIQLFIHVKDDLSGIGETAGSVFEDMRVDIQPPHASEWGYSNGGMTQISGTELDGVWRFEKTLPEEAETGTWTIPAIEATDRAGNEALLWGPTLKATGWDLTFENLP